MSDLKLQYTRRRVGYYEVHDAEGAWHATVGTEDDAKAFIAAKCGPSLSSEITDTPVDVVGEHQKAAREAKFAEFVAATPASPAATPRTDYLLRNGYFHTAKDELLSLCKELERELAEQTRLRQMAENERDGMLEKLIAARKDAERYRWLLEDHPNWQARKQRDEILRRLSVMGQGAAAAAIDAAIQAQGAKP